MTEDQIAFVAKQRALFDEIVRTTWRQHGNFNVEDVHASDMELLHNSGKEQFIHLICERVSVAKMADLERSLYTTGGMADNQAGGLARLVAG